MGVIGGTIGYRLLRLINDTGSKQSRSSRAYEGRSKLEAIFGPRIWSDIEGKSVIDFGCGSGKEAIEMAGRGAKKVIGIDIRENALAEARLAARQAGVADRCLFATGTEEKADLIISLDAFEHFADPAAILRRMRGLLKDDGRVIVEFGPPWYHPLGGHFFSIFPWAHLVFTEDALIRWRSDFKSDGATRFGEVEGGLNQMSISRFEDHISKSEFCFESFRVLPIKRLRFLVNPLMREFFAASVQCRLAPVTKL